MQKVIPSRFSVENMGNVARILGSNICENYFEIIGKFTEGKRIDLDKMDNWIVLQQFAADLRSDINY